MQDQVLQRYLEYTKQCELILSHVVPGDTHDKRGTVP